MASNPAQVIQYDRQSHNSRQSHDVKLSQAQLEWRLALITFDGWQLEEVQATFDRVFRDFQTVGVDSAQLDIEDRAWLHLVCHHARKHFQELQAIAQLRHLPGFAEEGGRYVYRSVQHYALHTYLPSQTAVFDRLCLDFLTRLLCTPTLIYQLEERYESDYYTLLWQTWELRSQSDTTSWSDSIAA